MIGKILGNRYEIIEQIGGGGMALVYKAKCSLLDRFVAIKILRDEFIDDEDFIRKFKRESQAAASLSHPNILNIYDVGVEDDGNKKIHYIVMEYINGKNLKEIIKQNGKLSLEETIYYTLQIAEALQNAHRNHIVHRDIKPQNIMVTEDKRVKVTDFGIARAATSSTVTTTSNVLGSVHYFSPEQARGGYTDEKSDIYSLGIVMYEMITGKLPFDGESPISVALKHVQDDIVPPRELDNTIPIGIETIILKAVQKRQGDRYNNIGEMIKDLKNINTVGLNEYIPMDSMDSQTRIIPIVRDESENEMNRDKKTTKKKKKRNDGGGRVIFLGIILAFLLVSSIFFGMYRLRGFFDNDEIIVPSIIGLDQNEAKQIIEGKGLIFKVIGEVKDSNFEKGQVVTQSRTADSKVRKGFPIEVTISSGVDLVKVPSVENKELAYGESLIRDAGLNVGISYEYSETIPVDVIIRQSPEPFENVAPGTKVNLVISQGTEIKMVIMPKLVGENITNAKNTLISMGLVPGEVKYQPNDNIAKDIVTWQEYEQGNELETGTSVDLYVSEGPGEVIEETPPEEENEENNQAIETPITFTLSPFQDRESTEIKIVRTQDGVSTIVYKKKHKASDGEVVIPLMGKKGALFDILYDDVWQYTEEKKE